MLCNMFFSLTFSREKLNAVPPYLLPQPLVRDTPNWQQTPNHTTTDGGVWSQLQDLYLIRCVKTPRELLKRNSYKEPFKKTQQVINVMCTGRPNISGGVVG